MRWVLWLQDILKRTLSTSHEFFTLCFRYTRYSGTPKAFVERTYRLCDSKPQRFWFHDGSRSRLCNDLWYPVKIDPNSSKLEWITQGKAAFYTTYVHNSFLVDVPSSAPTPNCSELLRYTNHQYRIGVNWAELLAVLYHLSPLTGHLCPYNGTQQSSRPKVPLLHPVIILSSKPSFFCDNIQNTFRSLDGRGLLTDHWFSKQGVIHMFLSSRATISFIKKGQALQHGHVKQKFKFPAATKVVGSWRQII